MNQPAKTPSSFREALWLAARQQWPLLAGLLVVAIIDQLISLGLPYLTKLQLDVLARQSSSWSAVLTVNAPLRLLTILIVVTLGLDLIQLLTGWWRQLWEAKVGHRVGITFNNLVFARLRHFDASLLSGRRSWFIIKNASAGSDLIWQLTSISSSLISVALGLIVIVPVIVAVDGRLLGIIIAATLLQLWLVIKGVELERQKSAEGDLMDNQAWINDSALEGTSYLQLVLMNADRLVVNRYHAYRTKSHLLDISFRRRRNVLDTAQWMIRYGTFALIAWLVGRDILLGVYSIGTFTLLTAYSEQLQRALVEVLDLIQNTAELRLTILKYGYLFSLESALTVNDRATALPMTKTAGQTEITLRQLSFTYPDMAAHEREYLKRLYGQATKLSQSVFGPRWQWATEDVKRMWEEIKRRPRNPEILHSLDVTIPAGSVVALVGPNGAGKTTLTRLLTRCYDPTRGAIYLNERPYADIELDSLRGHIGLLTQDPYLIDGYTIRDNLKLGTTGVTDPVIWATLRKLDIDGQIKALPKGLNMEIGRDGDLSGGQRQLLAAARVLLQQRPLIIFDEATSQLDAGHELRFIKQLQQLKGRATVIIITHRLTTARHADKVLVLNDGRIVQEGIHNELKKRPGLYRRFWLAQVGS